MEYTPHQRGVKQKQIYVRYAMTHISEQLTLPAFDCVAREVMHDIHQHINVRLVPRLARVRSVLRVHAGIVFQLWCESCARIKMRWVFP